ncbi:MAG: type II toxin-antitoxin system CcdA family antitoxin [Candidatus Bathyarchaeia archaeon]
MTNKRNLVLYVDSELIEKTKELGFNLSKTFENHMKHLLMQYSTLNTTNNNESTVVFGSPGETIVWTFIYLF